MSCCLSKQLFRKVPEAAGLLSEAHACGARDRRYTEGAEPQDFVALFPGGRLFTLPGGTASGFTAPEGLGKPTLYRVAGARRPRISQVPLEAGSLNDADGFVLDDGAADVLVQWFGGAAPLPALKLHVLDLAEELRSSAHGGSGKVRA